MDVVETKFKQFWKERTCSFKMGPKTQFCILRHPTGFYRWHHIWVTKSVLQMNIVNLQDVKWHINIFVYKWLECMSVVNSLEERFFKVKILGIKPCGNGLLTEDVKYINI